MAIGYLKEKITSDNISLSEVIFLLIKLLIRFTLSRLTTYS